MTKTAGKILAVLLSVLMCTGALTSLPATVFAAETTGNVGGYSLTINDLTWTLDDDGTLTISGNGEMSDDEWDMPSRWWKNIENVIIKDVVIENGVTSIGDSAFKDCTDLTSVTIPDSVTSIGCDAFSGCESLTSVTIPDSVTNIGDGVFEGCTCLTSISVGENNSVYDSRNHCNAVIETATDTLLFGCQNTVIPDSVEGIGGFAFYGCKSLTSVTIPDSVEYIGSDAFYGCTGLKSVTISNSVTNIDQYAFFGCKSLTSLTIPDSVKYIGYNAFYGCIGLTSISVAENNPVYDSRNNCNAIIDTKYNVLLIGCPNTVIPDGVTIINSFAFEDRQNLTSITIPDSVKEIGEDAFYGCTGLTSITVAENNSVYDSRNHCNAVIETATGKLLFGCQNTVIPDGVTGIDSFAFNGCTGLTSINIPDSVTSIGYRAFYGCTGLTSVTIPDSVTSIDDYAFGYYNSNHNFFLKNEGFIIRGSKGSAAEAYANENGFVFIERSAPAVLVGDVNGDGKV
ncbi:MAG: leucine-rich repeat protein, partial [Ruminococcus sp.]|nr:leucine-rich repeat protein [Ruminococcus sp.]